jgi:hypothetical protein
MKTILFISAICAEILCSSAAWAFHVVDCSSQDQQTKLHMLVDAPGNVITAELTYKGQSFSYELGDGDPPIFIGKGRSAAIPVPPLTLEISPDGTTADLKDANQANLSHLDCQ